MTPLPKRKLSTRRQGKRRAGHVLLSILSLTCSNCQKVRLPHRVCPHCGFYNGKLAKAPKVKKVK